MPRPTPFERWIVDRHAPSLAERLEGCEAEVATLRHLGHIASKGHGAAAAARVQACIRRAQRRYDRACKEAVEEAQWQMAAYGREERASLY